MALSTITKGAFLHTAKKDRVQTLEILVKGQVQMDNGNYALNASVGAILGLAETPGEPYRFTYQASTDAQVMCYPFESQEDIIRIVRANAKICPLLASECIRLIYEAVNIRNQKKEHIEEAYARLLDDYAAYPDLCASVGEYPQSFESMRHLKEPVLTDGIQDWEIDFLYAMFRNAEEMRNHFFAVSPDLAGGIIMSTVRQYETVSRACEQARDYETELARDTADFSAALNLVRAKAVERDRNHAFHGDGQDAPPIQNALDTILGFAAADPDVTQQFREGMLKFREMPGRYATTDDARTFRRSLGRQFYDIYFSAFLKSMEHPDAVPSEVKMLFMFGFIDEVLAGEENTAMLYSMMRNYQPDPVGRVLTAYEWLQKIYRMEVDPSKNEFDQDYPTYLRDLKTSGDIRPEQVEELLVDPKNRFLFEAKNFFTIGGRVTFGHAASFVPFFDNLNVTRPLVKAYLNADSVNQILDRIRGVDFGLFSRQRGYFNKSLGISQLFLDEVVLPYIVLSPIVGCRGQLWQEIDGKDRGTPARMQLPVFHTEDADACLLQLCGDFRWEMCKTEQGVHWNDVTDPSLTALYCDYLQFFKKNRTLSEENKEKIRTTLKKYSNDYKKVFIGDYMTYINYEAGESPRLNKVAREILFTFCPFPKELREKMADNPQYRELIKKHDTQAANKARPLAGLINKLKKEGAEVPPELMHQYQVLQS